MHYGDIRESHCRNKNYYFSTENTLFTKVKYIVPYVKCNLASFKTGLINIQQLLTEILFN